MIISIHQPMYLPWAPYIAKLIHSDIFVLYNTVQYPGGRGFTNRNFIYQNNDPILLTLPLVKHSLATPINKIKINNEVRWFQKHSRTFEHCYRNTDHADLLQEFLYLYDSQSVDTDFQQYCFRHLSFIIKVLKLETKLIFASDISENTAGLDSIISIIKKLKGTKYITGTGQGSMKYIEPELFKKNNIKLKKITMNPNLFLYSGDTHRDGAFADILLTKGSQAKEHVLRNTSVENF